MNILALDDEELALEGLVSAVRKAEPFAVIYPLNKPKEARILISFLQPVIQTTCRRHLKCMQSDM